MKLGRVADNRFFGALTKLSTAQLPLKTAFKLKGVMKVVREEHAKYEDVRREALNKHGEKNEDGSLKQDENGNVSLSEEGSKAFIAELNELFATEVEVPQIKLSELGNNVNMNLEEIELLDDIVVAD